MSRVVISCTTLPDRYWKLEKMLESIFHQNYPIDAIYIGLPKIMKRDNIPYGPLPNTILKNKKIKVVPCEDYGPITKLLGALYTEQDLHTVIITVDDDKIYDPNMVSKLMKHHHKYPDIAIGSSGMLLRYPCPMCAIFPNEKTQLYRIPKFTISNEGRKVDSIYGYPGALYVRKFFPKKENIQEELLNYTTMNKALFMNDDILISGYLSLKGVERKIFKNMPSVESVLDEQGLNIRNPNEISYNLDKFFQRLNKASTFAKEKGMFSKMEYYDVCTESVCSIAGILAICVLILISVFYYAFTNWPRQLMENL